MPQPPVPEVRLLRWPEDQQQATDLVQAGVAVLYVVQEDADPPGPRSCLEDWVRMPGDERDLRARLAALERRAEVHGRPPSIDALGRLQHNGKVLALSPVEARLAAALVNRLDSVVADSDLVAQAWDGERPSATSLRAHMARLRSRFRAADLVLRRVRGRGYVLERR